MPFMAYCNYFKSINRHLKNQSFQLPNSLIKIQISFVSKSDYIAMIFIIKCYSESIMEKLIPQK